jgi:outer membrane protein OmpA-like peptidoglycan-associated protein
MKSWLMVILAVSLLFGCVARPKPVPVVEKNPRIIERDLSGQRLRIERPVAAVPRFERLAIQPAALEQKREPLKFEIEFVNDSRTKLLQEGEVVLQEIKTQAGEAESVVLIGHSNGVTAVGNSLLASSRADYVAAKLVALGISRDKIKTLASWSPKINQETPAKGVQVFMMVSAELSQGKSEKTSI